MNHFQKVVFDSYRRRLYDKAKPSEIRQAIHNIVVDYNTMIARAKNEPLPPLLDTAYLLGGGAALGAGPAAIAAAGTAGGAGGRSCSAGESAGAGAAVTAAALATTGSHR